VNYYLIAAAVFATAKDRKGMGHANREMSGRHGKQLLDNIQWRRDCAAKVGLGFK